MLAYQPFNHPKTAAIFTGPPAIFYARAASPGGSSIDRHSEIVSISPPACRRGDSGVLGGTV